MTRLTDAAVSRLRTAATWPSFDGTRYAIVEEIGRGGMGTVFRASDALLGREVAIKVPNGFGSAAVVSRLQLEARVLARLEHPGIVPIHDAGQLADGRLFYVMKLVRGQTLRARLDAHVPLSERLGIFERICEPVAFAHAHGLVHRDLKPDNIMLGTFGEVLVMDWGAALLTTTTAAPVGSKDEIGPANVDDARIAIGSQGFMAPEQAETGDGAIDARADVYGLGALLFLLLTGVAPPDDAAAEHLASRREIPAALRAVCGRAMAPHPADRYADVLSLAQEVRRYLAGLAVDAHPETLLERLLRFGRTYRTAILLVLGYLVMRAIVAFTAGR